MNPFAAVVYAKDVVLVATFYEVVAGLRVASATPGWVQLLSAAGDFELVIHGIPAEIAATIRITTPPIRRDETPVKLVLAVRSIAEARTAARSRGGDVFPEAREWRHGGRVHCDGCDPEGNVFQLRALVH